MRPWIFGGLLALSGCFNPKLEDGFPCSDESKCPSGFECCDDQTCNRECGQGCSASDSCLSAAWQTCDCTCTPCSDADACEVAGLLANDLTDLECDAVAGTGCTDPSWSAFDNNNVCTDAFDGYCDDGGPGASTKVNTSPFVWSSELQSGRKFQPDLINVYLT